MELKSVTKYRGDGSLQYKEAVKVFDVKGGNGSPVTGQISCSRRPDQTSTVDQELIRLGVKLDDAGYMKSSFYVTFRGKAGEKALALKNGAIIEDVVMKINPFPYVKNVRNADNTVSRVLTYRGYDSKKGESKLNYDNRGPQFLVLDFNERASNNGETNTNTTQQEEPFAPKQYPRSPMYAQAEAKPQPVVEESDNEEPEY